jgi:hypothetical protein
VAILGALGSAPISGVSITDLRLYSVDRNDWARVSLRRSVGSFVAERSFRSRHPTDTKFDGSTILHNALASQIELAPEDGEVDRQPDITVEDVLSIKLKTTLVILSACESGMSKIHAGEELVGLTHAFLYATHPLGW